MLQALMYILGMTKTDSSFLSGDSQAKNRRCNNHCLLWLSADIQMWERFLFVFNLGANLEYYQGEGHLNIRGTHIRTQHIAVLFLTGF